MVEFSNVSKGFGERLLIDDLSFSLPKAGIVGVIGANGAGKTTLFRMIVAEAGEAEGQAVRPDSGTVDIGPTVHLAYIDQSRDVLDDERTVYEEITDGPRHGAARRPRDELARLRGLVQLQRL